MYKNSGCLDIFLAIIILVFSFWQIPGFIWIIIVAGFLLLIKGIMALVNEGCNCMGVVCGPMEHRTGSELIMEKSKPLKPEPSREEVKEVMKGEKKNKKNSGKKKPLLTKK